MPQLIAIVITTFLAVLVYKKMSRYFKGKGLGKGSIFFVAFIPSVLLYIVMYSVLHNLTSPTIVLKYKNTDNEIVYLEFNDKDPLEMSLYKSIKSYPIGSVEFARAVNIYLSYGISLKDFDEKIRPDCQKDFNKLSSWYGEQVKYWQQFPVHVRNVEIQKALELLTKKQKIVIPKMEECFYTESQKLTNRIPRNPDAFKFKYMATTF
ncbi:MULTISPECIES: hypothetical protein [Providencia]|uniref:hypothetical protein n=1 Tax=Providencia TaxID=586 RepID=UPI0008FBABA5|nr:MULTISPECIES: hypothetical protein [Providencia]HCI97118.1 hypothetical protein [Providencia sp.]APC12733.1 hypothetical protein RB151_030750 [Providencia rettgeri]EKH6499074.1 hypothetical protein [Providencia rettgeri]ELR5055232.1 hypothetical protein [Providencia rettgeri]ELR5157762.1 hypothetical protein [Providencia rettgeri]